MRRALNWELVCVGLAWQRNMNPLVLFRIGSA
jgi:hypothetical protein